MPQPAASLDPAGGDVVDQVGFGDTDVAADLGVGDASLGDQAADEPG
jgi:hypothetical protein